MRKLLMISAMLLMGALSVSAQTYCYRFTTKVDKDGMKQKGSGYTDYFTFSGNICYESDKDGNLRKSMGMGDNTEIAKYEYVGTSNGIRTYKQVTKILGKGIFGETLSIGGYKVLYVSSDYRRINMKWLKDDVIWVYEYESPQKEEQTPTQLY